MAGAKGVDVQTTAAGVARINRELERFAARPDVHEHALHALLMELVVVAKTHDVLQQTFLVDLCAGIADLHAAPVRLARDQAVAFEQVAHQHLRHGAFVFCLRRSAQQLRRGGVMVALHVQPVQVQAFFSSQISPDAAKNLLDTYKYYGKGKFDYQMVDPNANPIQAQQAKITRDGTIVFTLQGRTEQVTSVAEMDFTSAILRLTNPGKRSVYFLTGHGEADVDPQAAASLSQLNATLTAKNYTVGTLNLLSDPKVPDQTLAVVIAGPLANLSDQEVKILKTYLDAGGGLVYLSEPPYFMKSAGQPNPFDQYITQNWGVDFGNNIIVDPDVQPPSVTYAKTFGTHPITSKLNNLAVFFPTAHSVNPAKNIPANISQTVLVKTSENAWGETDLANLDKAIAFDPKTDLPGPVSVAIAATDQTSNAKIVVIGDVIFATDKSFQSYGNSDVIINAIDWVAKQDNLLNLTPKNVTNRSLVPPQGLTIGLILLVVVFVIPGLVILMGIANWFQRRSKA